MKDTLRTFALLRDLKRNARLPPEALRNVQGRLLRDAVAHAYRKMPFYRRLWDGAGVQVSRVRSIEDVERLPIVDAAMVRAAMDAGEINGSNQTASYPTFSSSGTSGHPMRVPRGPLESRLWRAAGLRMLFEHGFRWRDAAVQFDTPPAPPHWLQRFGWARTTWIPPALPIDAQLDRLTSARADVVTGTPTLLRRISRAIRSRAVPPPRARIVMCPGEILDWDSRALIRDTFGADPISVYGLTEAGYIAWQCEARQALHVNADLAVVEVLGEKSAAVGRVIVTDLRNRTLPLIRYDTGDLAAAGIAECDCGRTLPAINPIEGRRHRVVHRTDGAVVTSRMLLDQLSGVLGPDDFQIAQNGRGDFTLGVTRAAAPRAGLAVARLRELLGGGDFQTETVAFPAQSIKQEVVAAAIAARAGAH